MRNQQNILDRLLTALGMLLLIAGSWGCSKGDEGSSASGEASARLPETAAPPEQTLPVIDLPGPVDLGSADMRRGLFNPCVHSEYAERREKHALLLRCVTAEQPHREEIRAGIYESEDGRGGITRQLAYFGTSRIFADGASRAHFDREFVTFEALYGQPHERSPGAEPVVRWVGRGRYDNTPTTLELKLDTREQAVHITYTHLQLYERLDL